MRNFSCIFIMFILSCLPVFSQTESCLAVSNELVKNKDVWDNKTAIDYILSHKDSFDMDNEIDAWFYNIALGTRYYLLKEYTTALPYLRNVTVVLDKYGDAMGFASIRNLLVCYHWEAVSEFYSHSSKEAVLAKMQKAKVIYEKYGLNSTEVYASIQSDIEALQSGKYDNLVLIQKAMEYVMSDNHIAAIPILEQVINQWPTSQSFKELAPYIQSLCNSYVAVGKLSEAENLYLKTLAKLDEDNAQDIEAYRNICEGLGVLYYQVHNYQKAKDYLTLSKRLYEKNMDFGYDYVRCLSNCAIVESGLNNIHIAKLLIDVAIKYLRNGIEREITEEVKQGVSLLSSITGVALTNDFDNQTNLTFQRKPYIQILSNAAVIYQQAGFWDDAVMCIKESIALSENIGEPNGMAYNNLATLYLAQSRVKESLPYLKKASSLCQTDYERNEILFNYALALWLADSSQSVDIATKTSENLKQSFAYNFAFLSQEERTNFYKHFEYYLPFLNLILYETGDESQYGKIYDNILTTKGLLLRTANNVKNAIMVSGDSSAINNYDRMVLLRQQIMHESDSLKRIEMSKEIEQLDKSLSRSAASYGVFTRSNAIKWEDVRNSLKNDDIAIEFYNIPIIQASDSIQIIGGEPRYCAVILKKGYATPHILPLCTESTLDSYENSDLYEKDLIYQLIWRPLEKELNGVNVIYFSADRELHKIAIEYALMPDSSRMCDKYKIFRLSSTRELAQTQKQDGTNSAVLFGGLSYDLNRDQLIAESRAGDYHPENASRAVAMENFRYGFEDLPYTREEVDSIAEDFKLAKNKKCQIITGAAGTEESFRALEEKRVDIIHLATHGFFWSEEDVEKRNYVSFLVGVKLNQLNIEDESLLRSGLIFSGANVGLAGEQLPADVDDGVLTAKELTLMNLGNIDMVVMSACQSGLGETTGEGVFGLQRGFKLAGANTLLMSLWKVNDKATCLLMTKFYKYYLSGKTKREALRQAQLELRSDKIYSSPEYWAAFILLDGLN